MPGPAAVPQTPNDDTELMRRVQVGDEAALGELMERWEAAIKALIARIVLNAGEAEELAQETFVRVWQQRGKFRGDLKFRPWVFSIAINLARNRLRWWRRRPTVELHEWSSAARAVGSETRAGADRLEALERATAVKAAIASLPVHLREAIVLFEFEEMSHAEIAVAVGASVKSVETRIHRAREKLRLALEKWV